MKKLILVANDSPQSGKTTFVRVLEQIYERRGIDTRSFYTNPAAAPDERAFWDIDEEPEPSHLLNCFETCDAVIVAVATGQADAMAEIFNEHDMHDSLLEFDAELCVAAPVNGTDSSHQGAVALGEAFSDGADYLILSVPYAPDGETAADWDGSYAEKVMTYLGANVVEVPEFDLGLASELEGQGMNLALALARRKELPRYLRDAVHSWELAFVDELDAIEEQIIPESTGSRSVYDRAGVEY